MALGSSGDLVVPERQVEDAVLYGLMYSDGDMKQLLSGIISPPTLLWLSMMVDLGQFENYRKAVQAMIEEGVVKRMIEEYKEQGKI